MLGLEQLTFNFQFFEHLKRLIVWFYSTISQTTSKDEFRLLAWLVVTTSQNYTVEDFGTIWIHLLLGGPNTLFICIHQAPLKDYFYYL